MKSAKVSGRFIADFLGELEDPSGFVMAFKKHEDGKGYVQEFRISWMLLYLEVPPIQAGVKMRLTGEFFWGSPQAIKWPQFFHQDPMARPDRTNTYKSPQNWGHVELVGGNHLPTDEPSVRDFFGAETVDFKYPKIQGVLPIRFEVKDPKARKFMLAIDKDGVRYRNLVANVDIDTYTVEKKGDPSTGSGQSIRVVEVLWDGRKESTFNYDWDAFVGYAKGTVPNNIGTPKDYWNFENMVIADAGEYQAKKDMAGVCVDRGAAVWQDQVEDRARWLALAFPGEERHDEGFEILAGWGAGVGVGIDVDGGLFGPGGGVGCA